MSAATAPTNTTATPTRMPSNTPALPELNPPPYTPSAHNYLGLDDEDEDEAQPTTTFTIHAPTTVHGSGNIIAVPPPDVPRLTAAVIATISQKMHLPRSINVHISCGVNVIGDRNVVGSPAIRPLATTSQQQAAAAAQAESGNTARVVPRIPIPIYNVSKRRAAEVCGAVLNSSTLNTNGRTGAGRVAQREAHCCISGCSRGRWRRELVMRAF